MAVEEKSQRQQAERVSSSPAAPAPLQKARCFEVLTETAPFPINCLQRVKRSNHFYIEFQEKWLYYSSF